LNDYSGDKPADSIKTYKTLIKRMVHGNIPYNQSANNYEDNTPDSIKTYKTLIKRMVHGNIPYNQSASCVSTSYRMSHCNHLIKHQCPTHGFI
jgi:uncharacterized protein YaaR (DUF327 family)